MKKADLPARIPVIFASSAAATYVRQGLIPTASQIGITDGAWSFADGSPPLNFQDPASGGVPPDGRDFNALGYMLSAWTRWQSAGGLSAFDASFAATVSGYPQGAVVSSSTAGRVWLCTADDNTTDPDSSQSQNWVSIGPASSQAAAYTAISNLFLVGGTPHPYYGSGTFTLQVPANVYNFAARVIGAGGGGGGANGINAAGSGGGGGGFGHGRFGCNPGDTLTIVVGAPGQGGNNSPSSGTTGGTSSVAINGNVVIASTGGGPGAGGNNGPQQGSYGTNGTSSGGQIAIPGNSGGYPVPINNSYFGGIGGSVPFGGSIPPVNLGNPGIPGTFPGGGGNGSSASASGGPGASGSVDIFI